MDGDKSSTSLRETRPAQIGLVRAISVDCLRASREFPYAIVARGVLWFWVAFGVFLLVMAIFELVTGWRPEPLD